MVVTRGTTETVVPVTVPMPGVMDTDVAPTTFQVRSAWPPKGMDDGRAEKDRMTGRNVGTSCGVVSVHPEAASAIASARAPAIPR